jgi:hypothetical protein
VKAAAANALFSKPQLLQLLAAQLLEAQLLTW